MLRVSFTCVLLLFTSSAQAALIQVSSSVTLLSHGATDVTDRHTVTSDFIVDITGGSGSGYYSPWLRLSGATNESGGFSNHVAALGAIASVNWPSAITVGDLYQPASALPYFACPQSGKGCWVPFTFGVSQSIHFVASTWAEIQVDAAAGGALSGITVSSSVAFDGIGNLQDASGRPIDGRVQITFAPEPGTAFLWAVALVGFIVARPLINVAQRKLS